GAGWDPVARELGAVREVTLVPDDPLLELPWLALPAGTAGYLAEQPLTLHVLDAERDRLAPPADPRAARLLAVGDPDFGFSGRVAAAEQVAAAEPGMRKISWPCGGPLSALLPQLPGARAEAADVVAGWKAADRPGEARLLSGAAATEATFKLEAPGSGVIHLATHGIVVGDTCARAEAGTRGVGGGAPVSRAR